MYILLVKKFFPPPTAETKILKPKSVRITFPDQDIHITMFQYKIIHNILATKMSLFIAQISDDVCPQCLADTHSLDHMFLRCSSVH